MSFLDAITCGFGAVVLLYMVISAQSGVESIRRSTTSRPRPTSSKRRCWYGYKNLVVLRNTLQKTDEEKTKAQGRAAVLMSELERMREQSAQYTGDTLARRAHINKLKTDVLSLEEGAKRLQGGTDAKGPPGEQLRGFRGSGDRKYLTGVKLNGQRILILVDASASMLDETLVNVLRMRNLPDVQKMLAPKWQRAVRTADWLVDADSPGQQLPDVFLQHAARAAGRGHRRAVAERSRLPPAQQRDRRSQAHRAAGGHEPHQRVQRRQDVQSAARPDRDRHGRAADAGADVRRRSARPWMPISARSSSTNRCRRCRRTCP